MGCTCSNLAHDQVLNPEIQPSLSLQAKPKPVIFSIIRNGHEVVRGSLKDVGLFLERSELEHATDEWRKLQKWFHMHQKMELGTAEEGETKSSNSNGCIGFLRMMDNHCNDIAKKANLYDDYKKLVEQEEELNAAFETNDLFQIKGIFYAYKDDILDLLKKEDELLMPAIHDMGDQGADLAKLMKRDILSAIVGQFGWESFLRYAFHMLQEHDGGMPRVRVYGFALYSVATKKQWDQWQEWIKEEVSESSYEELLDVIKEDKKK